MAMNNFCGIVNRRPTVNHARRKQCETPPGTNEQRNDKNTAIPAISPMCSCTSLCGCLTFFLMRTIRCIPPHTRPHSTQRAAPSPPYGRVVYEIGAHHLISRFEIYRNDVHNGLTISRRCTMKTLVLVFHPNLKGQSRVNAAPAKAVEEADRIVFQFPIFWFPSPALLKEWEDKVLEHGWAYGSEGHAFEGKEFGVAVSTGSPESAYQTGTPAATPSSSCSSRLRALPITSARLGSSRSPRTAPSTSPTRPSPRPPHNTRRCSPSSHVQRTVLNKKRVSLHHGQMNKGMPGMLQFRASP